MQLRKSPGITILGFVPDVRCHLAQAQVVVAPLRFGGGTRLKILEAFAMGRAVVSTTIGCEGLAVEDGQHLLIADESEQFAQKIAELIREPVLRQSLGTQGRKLVEDLYAWKTAGDTLEHALRSLVERESW